MKDTIYNHFFSPSLPDPEFSVVLLCTDIEKIKEIDCYYQGVLSCLHLSERLTPQEKLSQHSILTREWENELMPFLNLWSVKVYEQ